MWDDEAFYAGLRTLDEKRANHAPDDRLWEGDGVEWYFDTRRGENFRSTTWTNDGSVHCYWVGLTGTEVKPRFCLRPGYLDAIPKIGVEVAAREPSTGWKSNSNCPGRIFRTSSPSPGRSSASTPNCATPTAAERVDRYFAYGSPLSVQQPASLAKVQLVDQWEPAYWQACGPVMMPIRCDTAWGQPVRARAYGHD